jgi:hypothetical protein
MTFMNAKLFKLVQLFIAKLIFVFHFIFCKIFCRTVLCFFRIISFNKNRFEIRVFDQNILIKRINSKCFIERKNILIASIAFINCFWKSFSLNFDCKNRVKDFFDFCKYVCLKNLWKKIHEIFFAMRFQC